VLDAAHHSLAPNLDDPVVLDRFGRLAQAFDRIVIDCVPERNQDWAILLKGANVDGEIILTGFEDLGGLGVGAAADGRSTIVVSRRPLSVRARVLKRAFDLSLTVPVLVALSPLLLLTALLVKLDTPGPILFKQDRIGRGNRLFKVLKFRSMRDEASDMTGKRSTSRNDDRITRVGRFIRATSIDELPQLFNVLLGDMSLVGPRPHTIGSLAEGQLFWHLDIRYWHRHQLKPGITGLAQVRGFRGATHQMSDLTNRLQADMEYIQQWSIWRDLQILLNTFRVIVHHNAF
jgi:lipopolysaccharide/colanic/teichoic acid biosynthesis glycosyltransferase